MTEAFQCSRLFLRNHPRAIRCDQPHRGWGGYEKDGRRTTGLPDGGDGGLTAGLAVEGRGRVAEHGLLERHPLGRAGVDRVGRRHPGRVGVRRWRVVVVPLGLRRRVVGDADGGLAAGGRVVLGRHGLRRRAGALVRVGAFGFGERVESSVSGRPAPRST